MAQRLLLFALPMPSWSHLPPLLLASPGAVLGLPWRKARAAVRRQRHRWIEPPDPGTFAGLGLTELLGKAAAWCSPRRRDSVLEALGTAEREAIRARAAAILRGELTVFGHPLTIGPDAPIPWGLDPLSGHCWESLPLEQLQQGVRGADVKYPWALGRLDEALVLALGAWCAADAGEREACVLRALAWIDDFLRANPVGRGVQWACAMEVALRAANLAQVMHLLADRPELAEPERVARFAAGLEAHLAWVEAHLEDDAAVPNNHLVADLVGVLVVTSLLPGLPQAARRRSWSRARLLEELEAQVHPDGLSFEGSVAYHRLALELFTLAFCVDESCGPRWPAGARLRLQRMFHVAAALCSERGIAAQVGDNDSGRVLPLTARAPLDFSYLAPLGAALFSDAGLKAPGASLPPEAAWLLGREGAHTLRRLSASLAPATRSFTAGGLHVLRGAGALVVVSAGMSGQRGVGGHSHLDQLSFELHVGGQPCIVDSGTGTYTREPSLRNRMRGTGMHNTIELDGEEQAPLERDRPFALPGPAGARAEVLQTGPGLDRLVVAHDGYRRLAAPVVVRRSLVLDKVQRALAIEDVLEGGGLHEACWRLHLADRGARLERPPSEVLTRARQVPTAPHRFGTLAVSVEGPAGTRIWMLFQEEESPCLEPTLHSPGYGLAVESVRVTWRSRVELPARSRWLVLWG